MQPSELRKKKCIQPISSWRGCSFLLLFCSALWEFSSSLESFSAMHQSFCPIYCYHLHQIPKNLLLSNRILIYVNTVCKEYGKYYQLLKTYWLAIGFSALIIIFTASMGFIIKILLLASRIFIYENTICEEYVSS